MIAVPASIAIGSLTAPTGSLNAISSTAGATPRSGIGESRASNSVVFASTPAAFAAFSKSGAPLSFAAISAAFCLLISRAFCLITSSRTRVFTSSSFGTYGSCFPTCVRKANPREVRTVPETSPCFMLKARVDASGDGPRPRIGSSRAKKPDSCTARP